MRPRDYERAVSCHDDCSCHYCHYLGSVIRSHPRDHNTAPSGVYSVFTLQQEALPGPAAVYIITYLQCLLSFLACVCLFECRRHLRNRNQSKHPPINCAELRYDFRPAGEETRNCSLMLDEDHLEACVRCAAAVMRYRSNHGRLERSAGLITCGGDETISHCTALPCYRSPTKQVTLIIIRQFSINISAQLPW